MSSGAQAPLTLENFTFQSGYIQIKGEMQTGQIYINFTFQSGYIQIITTLGKVVDIMSLHSNLVIFKLELKKYSISFKYIFTFQSGYIQILQIYQLQLFHLPLHSNLVIFKLF